MYHDALWIIFRNLYNERRIDYLYNTFHCSSQQRSHYHNRRGFIVGGRQRNGYTVSLPSLGIE